jgi:hypothetical protein
MGNFHGGSKGRGHRRKAPKRVLFSAVRYDIGGNRDRCRAVGGETAVIQ